MKGRFILVTGGTGYIGSHTCVSLLQKGYDVVILDNLMNSNAAVLNRLESISGRSVHFIEGDVCDENVLNKIFIEFDVSAVIHFAALKSVSESVAQPLLYYQNNVGGLLALCKMMRKNNVKNFIFSSSATVYGNPRTLPLKEDSPLSAMNPYGRTKLIGEQILGDLQDSDPSWRMGILRYFNPVGAHESGMLGEDPHGTPSNLMPYITQVAIGKRPQLQIYGNDYPTPDGTGIRDYLHVVDLAEGHVAALDTLVGSGQSFIVNLGTGVGHSVLEVVNAFEEASGRQIPYVFMPRRAGDVAACYASSAKAHSILGWRTKRNLVQMCADSWRWQSLNPDGYQ